MRRLLTCALVLLAASASAQTTTTNTDILLAATRAAIGTATAGAGPLRVVGLSGSATGALLVVDASGDIGTAGTVNTGTTFSSTFQASGTANLYGSAINLGNSTGDTVTFTARLAGHLHWETDATYDIGATSTTLRPRDLFLSRNAVIGGTLGVTGVTTLTGALAANGGITVDTSAFTVADTSGNTSIAGTLGVNGNTTLGDATTDTLTATARFASDATPAVNYTRNLGSLSLKWLTLHAAELWVETLVAQNTMATIGGRILVGPTTTLVADLAAAGATMDVKHNEIASGDRVVLEASGKLEWLAVTSSASSCGTDCYRYSITRNLDGTGANDWYAGDAVFNTGTTADGFIDLYSVAGVLPGSTAGPTIVGNVRTGTTYSNLAPRWAIGNLNGLYGYSATAYGAAFGDPTTANLVIDATDGIRIRNGTTNRLTIDASGNSYIDIAPPDAEGISTLRSINWTGVGTLGGALYTSSGNASRMALEMTTAASGDAGPHGAIWLKTVHTTANDANGADQKAEIIINAGNGGTNNRSYIYLRANDNIYIGRHTFPGFSPSPAPTIPEVSIWGSTITLAQGLGNSALTVTSSAHVTVTNDLTVDTNTLYADSTDNRVGIVTTDPLYSLDVRGDMRASDFIAARTTTANDGYVQLVHGTSANIGYLAFHAPVSGNTRQGYLGWGATGVNLYLENSAHFNLFDGAMQFTEISEPSAGASNTGRLYAKDNGGGKTQLCVRFASGASQCFATEP